MGYVLLTGDFNSRTANGHDFIEVDCSDNLPLPDHYIVESLPVRNNCVSKVTPLGRTLLELCIYIISNQNAILDLTLNVSPMRI